MVNHHSSLVCFCCIIWICLSWQRPLHLSGAKRNGSIESLKIETITDPEAVKELLDNAKEVKEEFRPVPLPDNFSRYDNQDNDNFISLQELINTTGARRNAKAAFMDADKNGDGKISPEEFQGAPWTLNVSEILEIPDISRTNLTEEDWQRVENGSLMNGNALDYGEMEENEMNSTSIIVEDNTETIVEDSNESRVEDSNESRVEDSNESRVEDSIEGGVENSFFERIMKDSFDTRVEDSSDIKVEDTSERIVEDSFVKRVGDTSERIVEDSFVKTVEDTSESTVGESFQKTVEDTSESTVGESFHTKVEDSFQSRTKDNSNDETQSWDSLHS